MEYLVKSIIGSLVIFIIALLAYFYTPKSIGAFGYRTPMSMKNEKTWKYANELAKKLFLYSVIVFLISEVLFFVYFFKEDYYEAYSISFSILTIMSIITILIVEIMLRIKFDKNGDFKE
jgi:uncharacterized membrane protein